MRRDHKCVCSVFPYISRIFFLRAYRRRGIIDKNIDPFSALSSDKSKTSSPTSNFRRPVRALHRPLAQSRARCIPAFLARCVLGVLDAEVGQRAPKNLVRSAAVWWHSAAVMGALQGRRWASLHLVRSVVWHSARVRLLPSCAVQPYACTRPRKMETGQRFHSRSQSCLAVQCAGDCKSMDDDKIDTFMGSFPSKHSACWCRPQGGLACCDCHHWQGETWS